MSPAETTDVTPSATPPVVRFFAEKRGPLGIVLLVLAALALASAARSGYRAYQASATPPAAELGAEAAAPAVSPFAQTEYVVGALSAAMLAVVFGWLGSTLLAGVPRPTTAARNAEARWTILLLGGLTGLVLMLAGAMFFAYYFGTLVEWIDRKTPPAGAYKVLLALIAFVGGAGLIFFAVQPARADERNNPLLRRIVYGANVGLVSLLLIAGLLALNVLVALKVPSRLDTTATGLYSVSDTTKQYLAGLTTPVKIYSTFDPEEGATTTTIEMQRLLDAMREANPAQLTVERLGLQTSEKTISDLVAKYPQAREFSSDLGVLIVANPAGEKPQTSFVRSSELVERPDAQGGAPKFVGESRLIKEILFLAEDKTKPKVYFTAGHGELSLPDAAGGSPRGRRQAGALKTAVEAANAEALVYDASATPAVPADAAIVVIADPQTPLSTAEVEALRAFARPPRKGKLIIMAGPAPKPDGAGVADVNLAPLLADLGLTLGDGYVCNEAVARGLALTDLVAVASDEALRDRNPIAQGLTVENATAPSPVLMRLCRPVTASAQPAGTLKATPILETVGNITWVEPDPPGDPTAVIAALSGNADAQRRKQLSRAPRALAYAVSDGADPAKAAPRAVVFGTGETFADNPRRARGAEPSEKVFGLAVSYLRERPAVADVAARTSATYALPGKVEGSKLYLLPALIGGLGTIALGLAVWTVRRK